MADTDRQAGRDAVGSDVAELKVLLAGLPGIASIEVDLREDGTPRLRVRLDGSVAEADVGRQIQQTLDAVWSEPAVDRAKEVIERRAGLGRGLRELLLANGDSPVPSHLVPPGPAIEAKARPELALVAVEETAGGVSVRVADSRGVIAFSPVDDPRSLNQAIVSAVARLRRQRPVPRLSGVEVRDVEGAAVLTVVLSLADGRRQVGASLVENGMPFTLGKAVWEALESTT